MGAPRRARRHCTARARLPTKRLPRVNVAPLLVVVADAGRVRVRPDEDRLGFESEVPENRTLRGLGTGFVSLPKTASALRISVSASVSRLTFGICRTSV